MCEILAGIPCPQKKRHSRQYKYFATTRLNSLTGEMEIEKLQSSEMIRTALQAGKTLYHSPVDSQATRENKA